MIKSNLCNNKHFLFIDINECKDLPIKLNIFHLNQEMNKENIFYQFKTLNSLVWFCLRNPYSFVLVFIKKPWPNKGSLPQWWRYWIWIWRENNIQYDTSHSIALKPVFPRALLKHTSLIIDMRHSSQLGERWVHMYNNICKPI